MRVGADPRRPRAAPCWAVGALLAACASGGGPGKGTAPVDPVDTGPTADTDPPEDCGVVDVCDGPGDRRVFFEPTAGEAREVTALFAGEGLVTLDWSESGTLQFCRGEFPLALRITAPQLTLRGLGSALTSLTGDFTAPVVLLPPRDATVILEDLSLTRGTRGLSQDWSTTDDQVSLTLRGVLLRNNMNAEGLGGGLRLSGHLLAEDVVISENTLFPSTAGSVTVVGAGAWIVGSATLRRVRVERNQALGEGAGGLYSAGALSGAGLAVWGDLDATDLRVAYNMAALSLSGQSATLRGVGLEVQGALRGGDIELIGNEGRATLLCTYGCALSGQGGGLSVGGEVETGPLYLEDNLLTLSADGCPGGDCWARADGGGLAAAKTVHVKGLVAERNRLEIDAPGHRTTVRGGGLHVGGDLRALGLHHPERGLRANVAGQGGGIWLDGRALDVDHLRWGGPGDEENRGGDLRGRFTWEGEGLRDLTCSVEAGCHASAAP